MADSFRHFGPQTAEDLFAASHSAERAESLLSRMQTTTGGAYQIMHQEAMHFDRIRASIGRPMTPIMGAFAATQQMGMMGTAPGGGGMSTIQMLGGAMGVGGLAMQQFRPGEVAAGEVLGSNITASMQAAGLSMGRAGLGHAMRMGGMFLGPMGMVAGFAGGAISDAVMPSILRGTGFEFAMQKERLAQDMHRTISGRAFGGALADGRMTPGMGTARDIISTLKNDIVGQQGGFLGIEAVEFGNLAGATFDIESGKGVNEMVSSSRKLRDNFNKMRGVAFDLNMTFADLRKMVQSFGPLEGGAAELAEISSQARRTARATGFGRQANIATFMQGRDMGRQVGIAGNVAGASLAGMAGRIREQFSVTGNLSMDDLFRFGGRTEDEATRNFAAARMRLDIGAMGSPLGRVQMLNAFSSGGNTLGGGGAMGAMSMAGAGVAANPLSAILAPMSQDAISATGPGAFARSLGMLSNSGLGDMFTRMGGQEQGLRALGGMLGKQMGMGSIEVGTLMTQLQNEMTDLGASGPLKSQGDKLGFLAFRQANPNLFTGGFGMSEDRMKELFMQTGGNRGQMRALLASTNVANSATARLTQAFGGGISTSKTSMKQAIGGSMGLNAARAGASILEYGGGAVTGLVEMFTGDSTKGFGESFMEGMGEGTGFGKHAAFLLGTSAKKDFTKVNLSMEQMTAIDALSDDVKDELFASIQKEAAGGKADDFVMGGVGTGVLNEITDLNSLMFSLANQGAMGIKRGQTRGGVDLGAIFTKKLAMLMKTGGGEGRGFASVFEKRFSGLGIAGGQSQSLIDVLGNMDSGSSREQRLAAMRKAGIKAGDQGIVGRLLKNIQFDAAGGPQIDASLGEAEFAKILARNQGATEFIAGQLEIGEKEVLTRLGGGQNSDQARRLLANFEVDRLIPNVGAVANNVQNLQLDVLREIATNTKAKPTNTGTATED